MSLAATLFAYVQARAARVQAKAAQDAVTVSQEALAVAKQATTIAMAEHQVTKENYLRTACPILEFVVTAVSLVSVEERPLIRKKMRTRRRITVHICLRAPHESVSQVEIGQMLEISAGREYFKPTLAILEDDLVKDQPVYLALALPQNRSVFDQEWTSNDPPWPQARQQTATTHGGAANRPQRTARQRNGNHTT